MPGEGEMFRNLPDRPRPSASLLYCEHRVSFPGVQWPECGDDHPPNLVARFCKGRAILLPSVCAFMARYRVTFAFLVTIKIFSPRPILPLTLLLFLSVCRDSLQRFKSQWLLQVPAAFWSKHSADISEETTASFVKLDFRGYCDNHQRCIDTRPHGIINQS